MEDKLPIQKNKYSSQQVKKFYSQKRKQNYEYRCHLIKKYKEKPYNKSKSYYLYLKQICDYDMYDYRHDFNMQNFNQNYYEHKQYRPRTHYRRYPRKKHFKNFNKRRQKSGRITQKHNNCFANNNRRYPRKKHFKNFNKQRQKSARTAKAKQVVEKSSVPAMSESKSSSDDDDDSSSSDDSSDSSSSDDNEDITQKQNYFANCIIQNDETSVESNECKSPTLKIQRLLLSDAKVQKHVDALTTERDRYLRQLRLFINHRVILTVSTPTKAKILASCIIKNERETVQELLRLKQYFSVGEITKCIQILDAPRRARQLRKKLHRLEEMKKKNNKSVRDRTLSKLRTQIHNLELDPHDGSLSGAKQRLFIKWIKSIRSETLQYFLLNFPVTNWRIICDLTHVNPSAFRLSYFQNAVFSGNVPEDSLVAHARKADNENILDLLKKFPYLCQCYSYLRRRLLVNSIPSEAKHMFACEAPIEDLLWWYEELDSPKVEMELRERLINALRNGNEIFNPEKHRSNYGKLMERLLTFRENNKTFAPFLIPFAEKRLSDIYIKNQTSNLKIVILGDASSSMRVAIKSACIIASLLTVSLKADLLFFNEKCFKPKCGIPHNVESTISTVECVKASGCTSMASGLWPYYSQRTPVDLFILVSDEGENTPKNGFLFADLFKKYQEEIYDKSQVFLVSFLNVGDNGKIYNDMSRNGLMCKQFRLHPRNPDASKFDALLGMVKLILSTMEEAFETLIEIIENSMEETYKNSDDKRCYFDESSEARFIANIIHSFCKE